jgi:hypothetical protein
MELFGPRWMVLSSGALLGVEASLGDITV